MAHTSQQEEDNLEATAILRDHSLDMGSSQPMVGSHNMYSKVCRQAGEYLLAHLLRPPGGSAAGQNLARLSWTEDVTAAGGRMGGGRMGGGGMGGMLPGALLGGGAGFLAGDLVGNMGNDDGGGYNGVPPSPPPLPCASVLARHMSAAMMHLCS